MAKEQVRSVNDAENETIQLYLDAAELAAQEYMDRSLFATDADLAAAAAGAQAALQAALTANTAALADAGAILDADVRNEVYTSLARARVRAVSVYRRTTDGIVMRDDIRTAVLLITAHLYENRVDVIAGQAAQAIEIPNGARTFLFPHRVRLGF
jgi:predicted DCC family thiol-disulfide oxidoreductase YuxK